MHIYLYNLIYTRNGQYSIWHYNIIILYHIYCVLRGCFQKRIKNPTITSAGLTSYYDIYTESSCASGVVIAYNTDEYLYAGRAVHGM